MFTTPGKETSLTRRDLCFKTVTNTWTVFCRKNFRRFHYWAANSRDKRDGFLLALSRLSLPDLNQVANGRKVDGLLEAACETTLQELSSSSKKTVWLSSPVKSEVWTPRGGKW
ncbi:hypothetical protein RRG08_048203 [Elysia crispata]|uniref:Uncharacterized protein n=1 Tax=Elysia crispata TaxID=231223 RepID=A0AAE1CVB2_9GAST|nr:hypothetical protein RRG08_048203 [Elysia crispata]